MKKSIAALTLIFLAHLYIGYYTDQGVHGGDTVFFIKKHPTLQMRFKNLYTRDGDYTPLEKMNMVEANIIIDYCRYRLGINTRLTTQEELDACKGR